jgi:hypothetical protein
MRNLSLGCAVWASISLAVGLATAAEGGATSRSAAESAARAHLNTRDAGRGEGERTRRSEARVVGGTVVRFGQEHRGLPVLGASTIVRVGDDGEAGVLSERGVSRVSSTTPAVTAGSAAVRVAVAVDAEPTQVGEPRLAILPGAEGEGRLVWEVVAWSLPGGEQVLVDASDGALLARTPLAREVLGRVYPGGPGAPKKAETRKLPGLSPSASSLCAQDGLLIAVQYTSGGISGKQLGAKNVGPSKGGQFLYNPPADPEDPKDPFAAVNAYYHARRAQEFFSERLGVAMSGEAWRVAVVVNARNGGAPMNSAFFSPAGLQGEDAPGNAIVLGQGDVDFAADSDVVLHEYAHHVSHGALGYSEGQFAVDEYGFAPMGGSIDEGISDYFAATMNGDPALGEGLPAGLRRDISRGGARCPEDTLGEVHHDGELVATAAWEIRGLLGPDLADALVWSGAATLDRGAQPRDFATGVAGEAEKLERQGKISSLELAEVKEILSSRGLFECGRELSLDQAPHSSGMLGLQVVAASWGKSAKQVADMLALQSSFRYSFHPDPGATRVRFRVNLKPLTEGPLRWSLLIKQGSPVTFHPGKNGFPEPEATEVSLDERTGTEGEIEVKVDPSQEPIFHAVLVHRNHGQTRLFLEASSLDGDPSKPRSGAGPEEGSGVGPEEEAEAGSVGGCGQARGARGGPGWGLAVLVLSAARRGRRGRSCS